MEKTTTAIDKLLEAVRTSSATNEEKITIFVSLSDYIAEKTTIVCYEPEIDKTTEMPIAEAVDKLSSYWNKDSVEEMLLNGNTLWTPYAQYTLK